MAYLKGIFDAVKDLRPTMKNRTAVGKDAVRAFSPFLDSKKVFSKIRRSARMEGISHRISQKTFREVK
jgi:hypothetical protein